MPELPEVETVRRGLEPVLSGAIIDSLTLNRTDLRIPFPDRLAQRLAQTKCLQLRRRGKYLWLDFDNDETLVVHLGMSGSFTINPTTAKPHDHVIITTRAQDRVVYNDPRRFGMFFIVQTGQETAHPAFATMGPEPLGNDFHAACLMGKFEKRTSPVKTALLDQTVVAGIGNIYACEALYMAGIHPLRPCRSLSHDEVDRLVIAVRDVLQTAIEAGGSSLRDHRQTDGTMGYFQHSFKVYDRAGMPCPETGGLIERIVQAGRSTFYCPAKQR